MNDPLWFTSTDPLALLEKLYPMCTHGSVKPQTRQSRMYLLACARREETWARLPAVCRALVVLAEVYSDAPRKEKRLRAALAPIAERLMNSEGEPSDLHEAETELSELVARGGGTLADGLVRLTGPGPEDAAALAPGEWAGLARLVYLPFESKTPPYDWVPPELHSADLLREVYGRPHLFAPFHSAWRTTNALDLARAMYEQREFSAMPILADALEDAGCYDLDVLDHCRGPGPHVRGCWVLDQVLECK